MHRRLTRTALAAGTAVVACLLPAAASAETATIGSTLGHASAPNGELCTACIGIQRGQAGGSSPLSLTSPANGTVTSWSVRSSDIGAVYNLRILRPSGSAYTSMGASPDVTVPPGTVDSTFTNTVSLPVNQGDAIGVAVNALHGLPSWPDNVQADVVGYTPLFADGGTSPAPTDIPGHELLIQATIKFCSVPNVVGQAEAAATAAIAAHDCASTVTKQLIPLRAIKKSFSKKKKKKIRSTNAVLRGQDGRVLSQSIAAGTTQASPGTPVALTVGQVVNPPKKKKHKKKH